MAQDELLELTVESVLIRGFPLKLSHNKVEYEGLGIELIEFMFGRISTDEVGRLLITQNHEVFRATCLVQL